MSFIKNILKNYPKNEEMKSLANDMDDPTITETECAAVSSPKIMSLL